MNECAHTNDDPQACMHKQEQDGLGHVGMMQQTMEVSGCGHRQQTNKMGSGWKKAVDK